MRVVTAICALAALSACGGPSVLPQHKPTPLSWSAMTYAAADGPILVEVHGDPFRAPQGLVARAAAEAMTGAVLGHPVAFTADRGRAPRPDYRVVVVLGAAPGQDEDAACAGDVAFRAGLAPGQVPVFAAFCHRARPLSDVRGGTAAATGPESPQFLTLMRMTARELFRPPAFDGDRDPWDPF